MESPSSDNGKCFVDLLLKCHRVAKVLASCARLPLDELYCLTLIHTAAPSCVKELSRLLGARGPRTSKLLGSLERKGYLTRSLNVTDHRMEELALTAQGARTVEQVLRNSREMLARVHETVQQESVHQLLLLLEELSVPDANTFQPAKQGSDGQRSRFFLPDEE